MKRRVLGSVLTVLMSLVLVFPVYAEEVAPTDPYSGEPIEWDVNGSGEEDDVSSEQAESIPEQTYSFGELVEIREQSQKEDESHVSTQYMHLSVPGYADRDWSESNILVTLYRDGYHKEEVWLYRQQGFEADVRMPVGRYTFGKAEAKDGTRLYTADNTVELTTDKMGEIRLQFVSTAVQDEDVTVAEIGRVEPERPAWYMWMAAVLLVIIIVIVVYVIYTFGIKDSLDKRNGYRNDLMD